MAVSHYVLPEIIQKLDFADERLKDECNALAECVGPAMPLFKRQRIGRFCKQMAPVPCRSLTKSAIVDAAQASGAYDFADSLVERLCQKGLYSGLVFTIPHLNWDIENQQFADERMRTIMKTIMHDHPKATSNKGAVDFKRKYSSMRVDDVDWCTVCKDAKECSAWQYAFYLFYLITKEGLYKGTFKKEVSSLMPYFDDVYAKKLLPVGQDAWNFMCGERITGLHVFISEKKTLSYIIMDTHNEFVFNLFVDYKNSEMALADQLAHNPDFVWNFEKSLGNIRETITTADDFDSVTFWSQINFFRRLFNDNKQQLNRAVSAICDFYRFLVRTNPELKMFSDASNMSNALLFSQGLNRLIMKEYTFLTWSPDMDIVCPYEKVALILHGLNRYTTKLEKDDWRPIDLSDVKSDFYREIVLKYIVRNIANNTALITSANFAHLKEAVNFFYDMKRHADYPNKDEAHITNQEASLYRSFVMGGQHTTANQSRRIQETKSLLSWAAEAGEISIDDMVIYYLVNLPVTHQNTATAIPDTDLVKILRFVINDSKTNETARLAYPIMRLQLETEFRIGTIVRLKTDCIRPTMKPDQFRIVTTHKTSYGDPSSFVISASTYRILMDAIENTETLRAQCIDKETASYIFLRTGTLGIANIRVEDYTGYIKDACRKTGCPVYTASNFRDTHMTKALEWAVREDKSDVELSILTSHKNIDTTKNHYIDWKMEEMLEATYGLDLDQSDYINRRFNIQPAIPDKYDRPGYVVEHGCGACTSETCNVKNEIPCLLCKDFVTTIDHETYFRKAIDRIDRLIENSHGTPHDIEDLTTMKKLYVVYLGKILEKKEERQ